MADDELADFAAIERRLLDQVAHARAAQKRRRRRWTIAGSSALAFGAAGALALTVLGPPFFTDRGAYCHADASQDSTSTEVLLDDASAATLDNEASRAAAVEEACAALWDAGLVQTGEGAAPPLIVCIEGNGAMHVLPGADDDVDNICEPFGRAADGQD